METGEQCSPQAQLQQGLECHMDSICTQSQNHNRNEQRIGDATMPMSALSALSAPSALSALSTGSALS